MDLRNMYDDADDDNRTREKGIHVVMYLTYCLEKLHPFGCFVVTLVVC